MNGKTLLIALLFVAAAGGGYYVLNSDGDAGNGEGGAPVIDQQGDEQPDADEPQITARQAANSVTCNPEEVPREKRIQTPDGQWVELLNDATNVKDFRGQWPSDIPWSPIVRVKTDKAGQQWWVHEDGSQSTSMMMWRKDLGRTDGVLQIANPTEVMPMMDENGNPVGPVRADINSRR